MTSEATAVPPEQALTEALLSLSWPLPRTLADADAALTRLEEVRAVLVRLEQQSVGTEAWWGGQVDALSTQSGFVLEWWRPVLRDPDLDWTLNHQAHLTADLATLASAGARLLDQLEPAEEQDAAVRGRRAAEERRWGPAAVPPAVPGARPQPPGKVFGDLAVAPAGPGAPAAPDAEDQGTANRAAAPAAPAAPPRRQPGQPSQAAATVPAPSAPSTPTAPTPPPSSAGEPAPPDLPPTSPAGPGGPGGPPDMPRHRRPSYDFDDPDAPAPVPAPPAPAAFPQPGLAPRAPAPGAVPGARGPISGPGYPPPGYGPPAGRPEQEDDEEPGRLVPTGLRRHQRRLLMQTGGILAAIGVLCWWAVYTLESNPGHPSAAGSTRPGETTGQGVGAPSGTAPPVRTPSATGQSPDKPSSSAPDAPPGATASQPDATTVESVQVTLLGGSSQVPQMAALITVRTAGTGAVNVSASYYGAASDGGRKAPARQAWTLAGKTAYQYSVPIANSAYCGTTFTFTLSAGGHSTTKTTSPGC